MLPCYRCGAQVHGVGQYCSACGTKLTQTSQPEIPPSPVPAHVYTVNAIHEVHGGARGFGQIFGIDPRIAFLTFVIDWMLFGVEGLTWFTSVMYVSLPAGIALAYIAYKAQMRWYGDDHDSALIKGCILGLLTAIPSPLPSILYVPAGVLGLFHGIMRRLRGA